MAFRRKKDSEMGSFQKRTAWTAEEVSGRAWQLRSSVLPADHRNAKTTHACFPAPQDALLTQQVAIYGTHCWPEVASAMVGRTSKACSLRCAQRPGAWAVAELHWLAWPVSSTPLHTATLAWQPTADTSNHSRGTRTTQPLA
jgi:hypothetical protein